MEIEWFSLLFIGLAAVFHVIDLTMWLNLDYAVIEKKKANLITNLASQTFTTTLVGLITSSGLFVWSFFYVNTVELYYIATYIAFAIIAIHAIILLLFLIFVKEKNKNDDDEIVENKEPVVA